MNSYNTAEHEGRFDVVVTSFFIDTLDVLECIDTIRHCLTKSGSGLWLNVGPLHYHSNTAVPYSHKDIIELAADAGFEVISDRAVLSSYAGEGYLTMKPEMFNTPCTLYRLGSSCGSSSSLSPSSSSRKSIMGAGKEVEAESPWIRTNFVLL